MERNDDILNTSETETQETQVAKEETNGALNGRPPSEKTLDARKRILQFGRRQDGITNIELAQQLEVTTAASQSLARPLVAAGRLKLIKDKENGRIVYKTV